MIKKLIILIKIGRKLALSDALNIVSKIYEIPISLPGRLAGTSKMNLGHITGALLYLIKFFLKNRF